MHRRQKNNFATAGPPRQCCMELNQRQGPFLWRKRRTGSECSAPPSMWDAARETCFSLAEPGVLRWGLHDLQGGMEGNQDKNIKGNQNGCSSGWPHSGLQQEVCSWASGEYLTWGYPHQGHGHPQCYKC